MKLKLLLLVTVFVMLLVINSPISQTNAQVSQKLKIETFPSEKFLDVGMLKPGDKVITTLDVINTGNILFSYKTTASFNGGSKKYYDALHLNIKDQNGKVLYNGSLKDFKGLEPRKLQIFTKEKLIIAVEVPAELGNDYQGLSSEFKFKFFAEDTLDGLIPPDDVPFGPIDTPLGPIKLPVTATEAFNFLAAGLILLTVGLTIRYIIKFKKKITNTSLTRP
ncbi:hypothetical protein AM500_10705 [Bacillus sp. FJAT-18017]|uniref:hypothetical protein n=1 Tax=Bacillus sp. FJAT-18017 TaxID=1705566 RepID=UPI0006B05D98|nr:hypothetical protein [Bacillus sp. FJAT-18017]ALC90201.1 hypothetical protein AM500_10705 [Bacillus sp. FJAT-18017]